MAITYRSWSAGRFERSTTTSRSKLACFFLFSCIAAIHSSSQNGSYCQAEQDFRSAFKDFNEKQQGIPSTWSLPLSLSLSPFYLVGFVKRDWHGHASLCHFSVCWLVAFFPFFFLCTDYFFCSLFFLVVVLLHRRQNDTTIVCLLVIDLFEVDMDQSANVPRGRGEIGQRSEENIARTIGGRLFLIQVWVFYSC